jgi:Maltokinase N-terminal cap domain
LAQIHNTTMVPSKLELLSGWLPQQPWYVANGANALTRVGGFRLDDPDGEVGIEFIFVRNDGGGTTRPVAVRVVRVLTAQASPPSPGPDSPSRIASVTASGRGTDGNDVRGAVVVSERQ